MKPDQRMIQIIKYPAFLVGYFVVMMALFCLSDIYKPEIHWVANTAFTLTSTTLMWLIKRYVIK